MELRDKIAQLMPQAKDELAELVSYKSVADPGSSRPGNAQRLPGGSWPSSVRSASRACGW
jgi:hypothetical protein